MYRVSIYNKSKKMVAVYDRISTIKYSDFLGDVIVVEGEEILMAITVLTNLLLAHLKYQRLYTKCLSLM